MGDRQTGLAAQLEAVDASPEGPGIGAFFDLDGTVVSGFTAGAFYKDRFRRRDIGLSEIARTTAVGLDSLLGGDPSRIGAVAVAGLRHQSRADLDDVGRRLYRQALAPAIRPEARELIRAHQDRGHTVVLASSATRFQIDAIAEDLGVEHVLCSEVELDDDDRLTGALRAGMLWGEAKAAAARAFARAHGVDPRRSFAYANGDEDIALLAGFGVPCAVNPEAQLAAVAATEGWPAITVEDPQGGGLREALGTVAAVGGMNVALGAGILLGRLLGDRRAGANAATGPAFDLALAAAGVRLDVTGREHLWSHRPAVFVFNHQSNLDPIIASALVRRDFTATGKQEAQRDPAGVLAGILMDAVFLDRGDTDAAKGQLNRLQGRLAGGESVLIAPEGTRRPTPELGPFKHGAFHVAQQAGVPVVGIVLRNTGRLFPRGSATIRRGTAQVHVLEPVETTRWKDADVGAQAERTRDAFAETLRRWPGDD